MNRLSIRMILFIVVLSALHISAIAPLKPPTIRPIHAAERVEFQVFGVIGSRLLK